MPKRGKSDFGNVRQLQSGRWQARYLDEDGLPMNAPMTFRTSTEAWTHIATVRADRERGTYHDPRKGERLLSDFAREWIDNGGSRGKLAIRTRELYDDIIARHIEPTLGMKPVGKVTPAMVRSWYTALSKELTARAAEPCKDGGKRVATGATRLRQSYALLKAIMTTAQGDGLIGKNPCRIVGAGVAKAPERARTSTSRPSPAPKVRSIAARKSSPARRGGRAAPRGSRHGDGQAPGSGLR